MNSVCCPSSCHEQRTVSQIHVAQGLRDITSEEGSLLCFDEVMTGFRIAHGCAQQYFGITPDLTTMGKVIGECLTSLLSVRISPWQTIAGCLLQDLPGKVFLGQGCSAGGLLFSHKSLFYQTVSF